jgi:hypothetical protein
MAESTVWVFVAPEATFPSGVFGSLEQADQWIAKNQLSGVLTEYPVGVGVYDWAVTRGVFTPRPGKVIDAAFVGRFTSAAMLHFHYEDGVRTA